MKQYEAVIETLKRLGGCATFGQLNQEVFKIVYRGRCQAP